MWWNYKYYESTLRDAAGRRAAGLTASEGEYEM